MKNKFIIIKNAWNRKTKLLIILFFLIFSAKLSIINNYDSLSFDEIVSVSIAKKDFSSIWDYAKWEMHPPLYFYYLSFWIKFFGDNESILRYSTLFTHLLSIISLYFLGKELFSSKKIGLLTAFLFSLSPLFSFYGIWLRMYTMLFLFSTLSFLFFLKILKNYTKEKSEQCFLNIILYIFFTVLALFSHITALFVAFVQLIYIGLKYLFLKKEKSWKLISVFFVAYLIIATTYLPWFSHFIQKRLMHLNNEAWYFYYPYENFLIIKNTFKFLFIDENTIINITFFIIVFLCFVYFAKNKVINKKFKEHLKEPQIFSLYIYLSIFLLLIIFKLYVLRYHLIPAIGFFLFFAYILNSFSLRIRLFILSLLFTLMIPSYISLFQNLNKNSWKDALNFINQNEAELIIASSHKALLPLEFYYKGNLKTISIINNNENENDILLTTIKTNFKKTTNNDNIKQLKNEINEKNKIFLVFSDTSFSDALITKTYLEEKGYRKIKQSIKNEKKSSDVLIILYEKIDNNADI